MRTSIDANAIRLLAELDPTGRRLVKPETLHDVLFGDDPDGGPIQGVAIAISRLRVMGHDVRMTTHYVLPPRSRRPPLENPVYARVAAAIEAGYAEASDLAAHLGLSSAQLIQAVSRMRSRARYRLETVRGYRLYPTSVGQDLAA